LTLLFSEGVQFLLSPGVQFHLSPDSNGRWADWAVDAKGGDVVSLAAYLAGLSQVEAACELARALGIESR
jgi:hypothetical protein